MAPSPLHPRSTATSTLFASTLLASFVIVAIPHLFPCPRPHSSRMDSDNPAVIRKDQPRQQPPEDVGAPSGPDGGRSSLRPSRNILDEDSLSASIRRVPDPRSITATTRGRSQHDEEEAMRFYMLELEAEEHARQAARGRECPVPKPRGLLGRLLGVQENDRGENGDGNRRSQLRSMQRDVDANTRATER